jgi:hypothetical protein
MVFKLRIRIQEDFVPAQAGRQGPTELTRSSRSYRTAVSTHGYKDGLHIMHCMAKGGCARFSEYEMLTNVMLTMSS